MDMNKNRVPGGTPTGGQFAEQAKGEADVDLIIDTPSGQVDLGEWHEVDADDRWPGRFTAHTARIGGVPVRIDPGKDSYNEPGFSWQTGRPDDRHRYSGHADSVEAAKIQAAEAAEYLNSGDAEYDAYEEECISEVCRANGWKEEHAGVHMLPFDQQRAHWQRRLTRAERWRDAMDAQWAQMEAAGQEMPAGYGDLWNEYHDEVARAEHELGQVDTEEGWQGVNPNTRWLIQNNMD